MHAHHELFHDLPRYVSRAMPEVRVTRSRLFALFAVGMLLAGRVTLSSIARRIASGPNQLSAERRLRRFLANPAVVVPDLWTPIMRTALPRVCGDRVVLVFDPTPCGTHATILMLGLVVHRRVVPVAWRVVPQQTSWPTRMGTMLTELVEVVAPLMPARCDVTVLLDRGLIGPDLLDAIRRVNWHFVLRLRTSAGDQTRARHRDGTIVRMADLLDRPGQRLVCPMALFKHAGWRSGWVTIHWPRHAAEPVVLFSDQPGGSDRIREYRQRVHCEATYADWKQRGFHLSSTRVRQLDRLERLLLVLALITWWLHSLGLAVIRSGRRRRYDRSDRRDMSVIKLGRADAIACFESNDPVQLPLITTPTGIAFRWKQ